MSFWFSSVVDWIYKHVCTKLLSPRFLAIAKVFVAHTGNTSLHGVISRYHMQTMQVVSVLLGLVLTQAPLTSSSTRSVKCCSFGKPQQLLWLLTLHVLKTTRNGGRRHMHETNWIFKQTPPPHFCLKVVCEKGWRECIFKSLRYIAVTTRTQKVQFAHIKIVRGVFLLCVLL